MLASHAPSPRIKRWAIKPDGETATTFRTPGTSTIARSLPPTSSCHYWSRRLAGRKVELQLPFCHSEQRIESTTLLSPCAELGGDTAERLRELARSELTTPFTVLLAAWQAVLARHSGQSEFILSCGAPGGASSLQQRPLLVHAEVDRALGFRTLLRTVARRRAEGATHGHVPLADIVRTFGPLTTPGRHPLFQIAFVQRNALSENTPLSTDNKHTHPVDLALVWEDNGRAFRLRLEYPAGVIAPDIAARLPAHTANLLRAALALPEAPVHDLPMLTAAEYMQQARG